MMKRTSRVLSFAIALLCLATVAFGQETTGGIEGTVQDPTGAVVPNISVTIVNARSAVSGTTTTGASAGFRRTLTTGNDGVFRVSQVPPGTYEVITAAGSGFGESRYENVVVAIGKYTQITIGLKPGGNVTTVDVSASELPPIDVSNNSVQTNINAEKIELLPKGTGFTSLLRTVPGTRPESRTGGFSVDGASGSETHLCWTARK